MKLQQEGDDARAPLVKQQSSAMDDDGKPKRQFLKRKTHAVEPQNIPVKKYQYYADAYANKQVHDSQENLGGVVVNKNNVQGGTSKGDSSSQPAKPW